MAKIEELIGDKSDQRPRAERWSPANPHPLSQLKTELVWDGKYDEYGRRREVDIAGCAMPMQRIETIDQPRSEAAADGQLEMWEQRVMAARPKVLECASPLALSGVPPAGDEKRQRTAALQNADATASPFRNRLIWGDNKLVLASLLAEFKGRVDLIYIDPPFDVGADFTMEVPIGDGKETVGKDQSTLEMVAYRDMWGKGTDSYLHMMFERLSLMKELLSEKGCIYIHIGSRISHSVRLLADDVFGRENNRAEIIWNRTSAHANVINNFGAIHDSLLFFSKGDSWTWNQQYSPYTKEYLDLFFDQVGENGRKYARRDLTASMLRASSGQIYTWKGITPTGSRCWAMTKDRMDELDAQGKIHWPKSKGGMPRLKFYADEAPGIPLQDIWSNVGAMHNLSTERLDYSTQKPESVIERIVQTSSNEGDLVADFFCGSGTTGAVAERLGRRWLMADLGRFAIHTSRKRLIELQRKLHAGGQPYRAFDVHNLGRYERQWWQRERLAGADDEHRKVVLGFYRAEPFGGAVAGVTDPGYNNYNCNPLLHGRKGRAFVHVDGIDGLLTRDEVRAVALAAKDAGASEVHCLAWEFEMDLRLVCHALEAETGVAIKLIPIPREIMEKNRTSPPPFLEMAVLEAEAVVRSTKNTKGTKTEVDVKLTKFMPSLAEVPSKELEALKERAVKSGFDFIDFWAVDFEWHEGKPFEHHWQDYRTRKDRSLRTVSDAAHEYAKAGKHTICVKVVDVFGCDTSITVEVTV